MPWEVSKLLLQIQHMPRVPDIPEVTAGRVQDEEEEEDVRGAMLLSHFMRAQHRTHVPHFSRF